MFMDACNVETEYQSRLDALLPKERIARAAAMFQWSRDMIGRQLTKEHAADGGALSAEELKWHIALRMYGSEPAVAALIRRRLEDVSGGSFSRND